jgi:hypothetical protein
VVLPNGQSLQQLLMHHSYPAVLSLQVYEVANPSHLIAKNESAGWWEYPNKMLKMYNMT